jgi:hypothetical protein
MISVQPPRASRLEPRFQPTESILSAPSLLCDEHTMLSPRPTLSATHDAPPHPSEMRGWHFLAVRISDQPEVNNLPVRIRSNPLSP